MHCGVEAIGTPTLRAGRADRDQHCLRRFGPVMVITLLILWGATFAGLHHPTEHATTQSSANVATCIARLKDPRK